MPSGSHGRGAFAYATDDTHNAYQLSTDAKLGPDHVRNKQMRTRVASTACDELDPSRAIRALYASDELLGLVKAITGRSVHRLADPLGAGLYQCLSIGLVSRLALRRIGIYGHVVAGSSGGRWGF